MSRLNVTVPELTVPAALPTVADRGTNCGVLLKGADAPDADVVVTARVISNPWVESVEPAKPGVPPYDAWII